MRTRLIGLTGGIGSGKSTVAAILRELGAEVLEADRIARQVVEPGQPAFAEIVAEFGSGVVGADGKLDRKRLAERVFADDDALATINRITHPRIGTETGRLLADASAREVPLVVYEVPLLVENGLQEGMDAIIVVDVPPELQISRALARGGITEEEIRQRMAAQTDRAGRAAVADYTIDNSRSLAETRLQTEAAWADLVAGGPKKRKSLRLSPVIR